jgi:AraC-like DNA-binding protein/quercetin dioxygenase-like cupin family protein
MTLWSGDVAANGVGCQAVSQDGQAHEEQRPDDFCVADFDPAAAVIVATFPMPAGLVFDWHTHPDHQLAWAASGVLTVRTDVATWVLPPTRALWIPAGVRHETLSAGAATMRSAYVRPALCAIDWPEPTPVSASPLLAELIGYLEAIDLDQERRAHAETVLVDLLQPVAMTTIEVRMPADDRARRVADALYLEPADGRTLAAWGRQVGASERTLARAFLSDTGISFGRWRTLLRLHSALIALADGEPVGNVARHVGYESDSAFVAAFRRETGMTPAAYFRGQGNGASN